MSRFKHRVGHAAAVAFVAGAVLLAPAPAGALDIPLWQNVTPAVQRDFAFGSAMAYDSRRGHAVLFDAASGDLRSWDGSAWTEHAAPALGARMAPIAYDAARDRIVLFGGSPGGGSRRNDTWEWAGADWTEVATAAAPVARNGHAAVYDAERHRVVITGGLYCVYSPLTECSDTWEYDGTNWTQTVAQDGGYAPGRWQHAMAYDAQRHVTVLFGGANFSGGVTYDDTWEYDGSAWTRKTSANGLTPEARRGHALAYDPVRQRVVLYGGSGIAGDERQWEWDGVNWTRVPLGDTPGPGARQYHAMTYDVARQRLVLTGDFGSGGSGAGEVWELHYATAYTASASVGSGAGSIDPPAAQVQAGARTTFTLTPADGVPGNRVLGVRGSCGGTLAGNVYTIAAIERDCTVIADFGVPDFIVTPQAGAHGTIAPAKAQTVAYGATPTFTVNADAGYHADVGGSCGGALSGNAYTTAPVMADCTVEATFVPNTYTVMPSAGAGGTINPAVAQTVVHGSKVSFVVAADAGFHANVGGSCGGVLVGDAYTTDAISADCTVEATFAPNSYPVTPHAGANGSISPVEPVPVAHGSTMVFTVSADAGYRAVVGGTCGGSLSGTIYTTAPITAACTVDASFARSTYVVTPSAGAHGTISPNAPQTIAHGETVTFTLAPEAGYSASVSGTCGGSLDGANYTTAPVAADCTVAASFFPRRPARLDVIGGAGQQAVVGTAFAQPLQVRVTDAGGEPLAGVEVEFSAPSSGASARLSSGSVLTDGDGLAAVSAVANGVEGRYEVDALVRALEIPRRIALTNLPGAVVEPPAPVPALSTAMSALLVALIGVLGLFARAASRRS